MKVYLCGPMTGLPNDNREAFAEAQKRWEDEGFEVINPAAHEDAGETRESIIERDIKYILSSDALVLLEGFSTHDGCKAEIAAALWANKSLFDDKTFKVVYLGLRFTVE